jgi:hypothetical protein
MHVADNTFQILTTMNGTYMECQNACVKAIDRDLPPRPRLVRLTP